MTKKHNSNSLTRDTKKLDNNTADWVTSILKGGLGVIPIAGSLLAEIIGTLIPNQRMDRIAEYVKNLNRELELLPSNITERLRNSELFVDLVEESCIKASRAISEERHRYILNIVKNGISDDDADINNAKYLLGLLSEINDAEVIWLNYFHEQTIDERANFQEMHKNVLKPIYRVLGSDRETLRLGAIQDSYKDHLERLGLIHHKIEVDKNLGVPKYDKFSNKPKVSRSETTILGDALLESIGLIAWHLPFAE